MQIQSQGSSRCFMQARTMYFLKWLSHTEMRSPQTCDQVYSISNTLFLVFFSFISKQCMAHFSVLLYISWNIIK